MIEYQPWYEPGTQLARCLTCGSLVSSADTETHTKWHEEFVRAAKVDVIEMLGKRLDSMASGHSPQTGVKDRWVDGFDDGWNSARSQINETILNPKVDAHIRGERK